MPIDRWMHVDYRSRDGWVLPIWTAHNDAFRNKRCGVLEDDILELGMYVSTRLSMLPTVYKRVNDGAKAVLAAASKRESHHEWTDTQDGYVYRIADTPLYDLLLDLDSLLFEVNSSCELMTRLFGSLNAHIGRPLPRTPAGLAIRHVLELAGQDTSWFRDLDTQRNFFAHEGAPFFAVDLTNAMIGTLDLLVMKKNLRRFDERDHFVCLSELAAIVRGFEDSKWVIQKNLIEIFA